MRPYYYFFGTIGTGLLIMLCLVIWGPDSQAEGLLWPHKHTAYTQSAALKPGHLVKHGSIRRAWASAIHAAHHDDIGTVDGIQPWELFHNGTYLSQIGASLPYTGPGNEPDSFSSASSPQGSLHGGDWFPSATGWSGASGYPGSAGGAAEPNEELQTLADLIAHSTVADIFDVPTDPKSGKHNRHCHGCDFEFPPQDNSVGPKSDNGLPDQPLTITQLATTVTVPEPPAFFFMAPVLMGLAFGRRRLKRR